MVLGLLGITTITDPRPEKLPIRFCVRRAMFVFDLATVSRFGREPDRACALARSPRARTTTAITTTAIPLAWSTLQRPLAASMPIDTTRTSLGKRAHTKPPGVSHLPSGGLIPLLRGTLAQPSLRASNSRLEIQRRGINVGR